MAMIADKILAVTRTEAIRVSARGRYKYYPLVEVHRHSKTNKVVRWIYTVPAGAVMERLARYSR